jgi:type IV pilus assembly protein PilV
MTARSRSNRDTGRTKRVNGFTLLETIVALAVLSIGVLGVTTAMISAMNNSRQSRSMTQAIYVAQQQLETFRLMPEADILALMAEDSYPADPAGAVDPDTSDGDPTQFLKRYQIQPDTPQTGVFTITVFVDWTGPNGNTRTTQLRSMVSKS